MWHAKEPSLLNDHERLVQVNICSSSSVVVTSPRECKILERDENPQTNKQTNKQIILNWPWQKIWNIFQTEFWSKELQIIIYLLFMLKIPNISKFKSDSSRSITNGSSSNPSRDRPKSPFVCLFVWCFSCHSKFLYSFGDVTIAGEGCKLWPVLGTHGYWAVRVL